MAKQSELVVVDIQQKKATLINVAILRDSNLRKKEHENLKLYPGLKEEQEKM